MTPDQTSAPRVGDLVILDGMAHTVATTDDKRTVCVRTVQTEKNGERQVSVIVGTHALDAMGLGTWGLRERVGPRVVNPAAVQAVPAAPQQPRTV